MQAAVSFDYGPEYPIIVHDPFEEKQEGELEWYFEEHLKFPFTKKVRAKEAAASITASGETLFKQVFQDNADIYAEYKALLKAGLERVQIEIAGSRRFHALHWEALKDPRLAKPLALQATMVRRNMQPPPLEASVQPAATIHLLVVTSRPYGVRDVSYRTISRPLVEALRQADLRVEIDILRPGTYKALVKHLQATTGKHGVGYYHVLHFDLHGSLMSYPEWKDLLEKKEQEQSSHCHTFQHYYALDDLAAYEGQKAFLFFEGEQDDTVTPVEASALASMLREHHIPIAILNACQSGKQEGESETSLGSHLMQAGVQLVLAMGYSVTVSAARLLMTTLYQHLFAGDSLALAIRSARNELFNEKKRRAYYAQEIDLEDWLLPVVYQNRPVQLTLRDLTPAENTAYYEQLAELPRTAPPEPTYGFVGRDLDILRIERRLLLKGSLLLVRGMGGAGKTTLLRHLGAWWCTTGLVERVFTFGYEERAWTRQQIMVEIAQQLLDPVAYLRDFQPLSLDAQQAKLTKLLRAQRHLLILDNVESITGTSLAIQHTLDTTEQEHLRRLLADLAGGQTLVLLGSRSSEDWLATGTFADNVYDLSGLDAEAASTLADIILEKHGATKYRQDEHFQHLLKLLNGFPLALEVVLDTGDAEDKTKSILRCIDYSHSNLSPEAQHLLLCLAPFTSVFDRGLLDNYTEHLQQQPALANLSFARWPEVLKEATNWGLLSPHLNNPRFLHLQPTLSYFLQNRLKQDGQAERKVAIEAAFREHYRQVGELLNSLLTSKDPQERQIGQFITRLEYENLVTALNLALAAQESIAGPYDALLEYLKSTQNQRRALELFQNIEKKLAAYPSNKLAGSLGIEYVSVIVNSANWQFIAKQYEEAGRSYQRVLEVVDQVDRVDEETKSRVKAVAYHQLGYVAQEQRQWPQAEQYYQQALLIKKESNDRSSQAGTYHQLGMVAQKQRQWLQAEQYYQQALHIYVESNDRYKQAITYHQLGLLAQEQWQWLQAEQYYQQALHIKIESNDRYAQASTSHQLGRVAQEQRQWSQAEQYYQQALLIYVESNDRYKQARPYGQLGLLTQEQGQWTQACDYLLQALEIFVAYEDNYNVGIALSNLALLWRESDDTGVPGQVAEKLGVSVGEAEELLRQMLGDGDGGKDKE
jgi:tetratricopeptide (TPR) repeat protein